MFSIINDADAARICRTMDMRCVRVRLYLNPRRDAIATGYRPDDGLLYEPRLDLLMLVDDTNEGIEGAAHTAYEHWQPGNQPDLTAWKYPRVGDVVGVIDVFDGGIGFFAIQAGGYQKVKAPMAYDCPESFAATGKERVNLVARKGRSSRQIFGNHIELGCVPSEVWEGMPQRGIPLSEKDLPPGLLTDMCDGCGMPDVVCVEKAVDEDLALSFCSLCRPREHAAHAVKTAGSRGLLPGDTWS